MLQSDILEYKVDLFHYSASHSGGNLVDGLPCALHTEAGGVSHGGFGASSYR